jgi:2-dehydropantoate 2-reductase
VETIAEVVGEERVLAGMTNHASTLKGIAQIEHNGRGETVIGHLGGKIPAAVRQIREVFNKAQVETKVSRNIKGVLWSKLIVNAGINALSAILRVRNGALRENAEAASILRAAVGEAVKVARRKRIKLIYDDPLAKVEAVCQKTSENVSSMLQDVLAGRRTEIDYINGVIVKQGRLSGVPTPVNQTLCDLVKGIERSYAQQIYLPIQE